MDSAPTEDAPFGNGYTWLDVQSQVERKLRTEKFAGLVLEDQLMEDILQDVLVDLLGYWVTTPGAVRYDGCLSFTAAVDRGANVGARELIRHFKRNEDEMPFDASPRTVGEYDIDNDVFIHDVAGSDPTPDAVLEELDFTSRAHRLLAELPADELEDYFDNLLSGESVRETAERVGVSHMTVQRKRVEQKRTIQEHARRYGLA